MKKTFKLNENELTSVIKKVIKENYSVRQLSDAIDNLEKIIKNFGNIDCDDPSNEEYINVYCEYFNDVPLEKIQRVKDEMQNKMASIMYQEFRKKATWMR
jgi:hypothetical protein